MNNYPTVNPLSKALIATSVATIFSLHDVLVQLNNAQYAQPLQLLGGNTIGKHTRHILEFYKCMFQGMELATVNYDKRKRDYALENDVAYCVATIGELVLQINALTTDESLIVVSELGLETFQSDSSVSRELMYNLEHNIHHMAILRIALGELALNIALNDSFGVAPSTLQYQKQCAQ